MQVPSLASGGSPSHNQQACTLLHIPMCRTCFFLNLWDRHMTTNRINPLAIHTLAINLSLVTYIGLISIKLSEGSRITQDACRSLLWPQVAHPSVRSLCQASYQQACTLLHIPMCRTCFNLWDEQMTTNRINKLAIHTQAIHFSLITNMGQISQELSEGSRITQDACRSPPWPQVAHPSVRSLCQASCQQACTLLHIPMCRTCFDLWDERMTTNRINQLTIRTQAIHLSLITNMGLISQELSEGSHTHRCMQVPSLVSGD
jgi:hypothetical protein